VKEIAGLLQAKGFAVARTPDGYVAVDRYGTMWFTWDTVIIWYGWEEPDGRLIERTALCNGFGPYDLAKIMQMNVKPT
jgi:hypothetical protein